jgi:ATP-dependent exoDNAse (exonuclease V) alpha subunit
MQEMINDVLGACFISQADAELLVDDDTTVLCTHRDVVRHYNNLMAHCLFADPGQLQNVPLHTNAGNVQELKEWTQGTNFHQLPFVAVNAKVILTNNLETSLFRKGAANGTIGTVIDVSTKQDGSISSVSFQLQDTGNEVKVVRSLIKIKYHEGKAFTKSTFPIALAYAITGHKSQGATIINKTIIHVTEAFCPGLLYVMLSRVPSRDCLKIVAPLAPGMFKPMCDVGRDSLLVC